MHGEPDLTGLQWIVLCLVSGIPTMVFPGLRNGAMGLDVLIGPVLPRYVLASLGQRAPSNSPDDAWLRHPR